VRTMCTVYSKVTPLCPQFVFLRKTSNPWNWTLFISRSELCSLPHPRRLIDSVKLNPVYFTKWTLFTPSSNNEDNSIKGKDNVHEITFLKTIMSQYAYIMFFSEYDNCIVLS